jgi:hypothetical protein
MGNAALQLARDPEALDVEIDEIDFADSTADDLIYNLHGCATFLVSFAVDGREAAVTAWVTVRRRSEPRNGSDTWSVGCTCAEGTTSDVASATVWLIREEQTFLERIWRMCGV